MTRAEDLRAVRTFLQEERYRIDMQLLDLDRRIMLAEHASKPPILSPGRRADDMPHPPAKADGVMLGVLQTEPRIFDPIPEQNALVFAGLGDEGDEYHGAQA